MALTELQRPDKQMFFNDMRRIADEKSRHMASWEMAADFINDVGSADLTAMGIDDAGSISAMQDLKTAVNDVIAVFNGSAVTPTKNPNEVVDKIRRMMPI